MTKINVYLSQRTAPNIGKYEIFRNGKATGVLVDNSIIRKMLSPEQYKSFLNGQEFFNVEAEKLRTLNHKNKKTKSTKNINFKF